MNIFWREIKTTVNFVDNYRTDFNRACERFKEAYKIAKDYARFKLQGLVYEVAGVVVAIIILIAPQLPLFTDFASFQTFMVSAFASGGFAGSSILSTSKKVKDFFEWNRKIEEKKIKFDAFLNLHSADPATPEQAQLSLELIQGRREKFIEEFVVVKKEEED
jgi:hypothetical protein